jgi:HEPN domain-containing protein
MTPRREQRFHKEYAHELLRIALLDFDSAQILARYGAHRVENVFLMAQQSLEKALKAVICWHELSVPFTHDIAVLVERLSSRIDIPFEGKFDALSEFATIRRYLEGRECISSEDAMAVLSELSNALTWCQKQIQIDR